MSSSARSRFREHGLTADVYEEMREAQDDTCAICGLTDSDRELAVDHDHNTGRIRGLLCLRCNLALGYMKDDPQRLIAAASYLLRNTED